MRKKNQEIRDSLPNIQMSDSSIVMTGMGPLLWFQNPNLIRTKELEEMFDDDDAASSTAHLHQYFVYKLSQQKCREYRQLGYKIYYLNGAKKYLESFLFYNLDGAGAKQIPLPVL